MVQSLAPAIPRPADGVSATWGTKAETLAWFAGCLSHATVPPLVFFSVVEWRSQRARVLRRLRRSFDARRLAVRSAALREDGEHESLAGHFLTRLDVSRDPVALAAAIDAVVGSYGGDFGDHVLVQPMVADVRRSGVAMTRDPFTGAPYVIVELADGPGTDAVTAGRTQPSRAAIYRGIRETALRRAGLSSVVAAVREVEALAPASYPLEIELAETNGGEIAILQVRPLFRASAGSPERDAQVARRLQDAAREIKALQRPRAAMAGNTTVLGSMPDWNPAELIGAHPSPLATSLFRFLITDGIWQESRAAMGYQPVAGVPLMHLLVGRPYIDVRASFNSFLPVGLPRKTRALLVDAWLERLRQHPELHDRVEFDVAETAVDFAFAATHQERHGRLLSSREHAHWVGALRRLTSDAISTSPRGSLRHALDRIDRPGSSQSSIARGCADPLDTGLRLLEFCRSERAHPFAVVARHAFIAEALLRSLSARGAWLPERVDQFRRALPTMASQLAQMLYRVMAGRTSRATFLDVYGHLRPGAFDVRSLPYALRGDELWSGRRVPSPIKAERFVPSNAERRALEQLLREAGFRCSAGELLHWVQLAMVGRDRAKFLLTRCLSWALERLVRWGEVFGLSRDDLAQLTVAELRATRALNTVDMCALRDRVARASELAVEERGLRLSHLLRDAGDLALVRDPLILPTFVTARTVVAPAIVLDGRSLGRQQLERRIVCVESADPGYDWIFTRGIAGFVTCFGGAGSHMAIRCCELDVPAALGVGAATFDRLVSAPTVELRCGERTVRGLWCSGSL